MENSNEVNDGPIHTSIMPKNSNENKNGLPKEAKILKKSNDQSFVNGCNLHDTILVHPKNNNFSSCIEVETNKLDNSSKLTSYCDEFAIKYLVNEMVTSIVNQTNVSSKLLTNGVDCFSLHQTNSELSREKKEANALPSTNKNTLRMSKRKRVPKKLDDEEKKEPSLPIVSIKHKIPTPETPILYNLGDLVWSYVPGHPLWPCMLTLDPLEFICSKMQGGMKPCRAYHVQFLGDSPEHGWVRESRVFPFNSPEDYDKIIKNLLSKSKKSSVKVPRMEIPARLKDDWDSGIEEILEASAFNNEDRITQYEYDFKPYMKEFKHLYSRRNKISVYKECKKLLKELVSTVCNDSCGCIDVDSSDTDDDANKLEAVAPVVDEYLSDSSPKTSLKIDKEFLRRRKLLPPNLRTKLKSSFSLKEVDFSAFASSSRSLVKNVDPVLPFVKDDFSSDFEQSYRSKTHVFKTCFNLIEKERRKQSEVGPFSSILISAIHKLTNSTYKLLERCSCTTLEQIKRSSRSSSTYTNRDLMNAVHAIQNGFSLVSVSLHLKIPRSTLSDYVKGRRLLRIKHHPKCLLFSGQESSVTQGLVTHVRAGRETSIRLLTESSHFQPEVFREEVENAPLQAHEAKSKDVILPQLNKRHQTSSKALKKFNCRNDDTRGTATVKKSLSQAEPDINAILDESQNLLALSGDSRCPGFTNTEILLAYQNYILQSQTSNEDSLLVQAFNQVAEGRLTLKEVVCIFGISEIKFKKFVKRYLPFTSLKADDNKREALLDTTRDRHIVGLNRRKCGSTTEKYNQLTVMKALDDLFNGVKSLASICRESKIPSSTLRDCAFRNKSIYQLLIKSNMSRQMRIETLKQNVTKFRMPRFIKRSADNNSTISTLPKSLSKVSSSNPRLAQNIRKCRKNGMYADVPSSANLSAFRMSCKNSGRRLSEDEFLRYLEDKKVASALKTLSSWGWKLSLHEVRLLIKEYLNEEKDCYSGRVLSDLFLLTLCKAHSILCDVPANEAEQKLDQFRIDCFYDKINFVLNHMEMNKHPSNVFLLQECKPAHECGIKHRIFIAVNAAGNLFPPLTIFSGDSLWCSYNNSYPGSQFALQNDCLFTIDLLRQWLKQFLDSVNYRPLVFIYDGNLTSLPLCFVQTLFESSCVFLKLPYSSINSDFCLPFTNIISEALRPSNKGSVCSNICASTVDVVSSIRNFCVDNLTPAVIRKTFQINRFFPDPITKPLSKKKFRKKASFNKVRMTNVELKITDIVSSSTLSEVPMLLRPPTHLSTLKKDSTSFLQDVKETQAPKESYEINSVIPPSSTDVSIKSSMAGRTALSKLSAKNHRSKRYFSVRKKRHTRSSVAATAPTCSKSSMSESVFDVTSSNDDIPLAKTFSPMKQISSLPVVRCTLQRHPVASLMSKSAGDRFDLKPHSPTACASTNEDQETTTSSADKSSNHCKRTKKFEVLDPNPSLFVSYYNKRCGPLKTERPNLTASQIRSRIEIEWDSLSPSRQKKYGKVDPLKLLDAPRKEMVPGKKGKKIVKIEQDQMESVSFEPSAESNKTDHKCSVCGVSYASQLSLSQHKRWCFLPKRKRKKVTNKVKEKSNSFDSGEKKSIDRLFKCDLCRDKFFSCKSLQIHKKFCTADKLASSVRSSSVKKSLKAIRNRSKISENTDKLSSSVLNGSPQNLSKVPLRRKEEGDEKSTGSVGQHLNEPHKTEKVRHDSSSRRGKPRGRPQLGSNAKRESLCIKCEVPGSDLLHCSGGCCQSIHIQCLDGEKPGDGDSYTCHNCETRSHPCFICKLESDDGRLDLGKIKRCSVPHCGRSYHSTCLQSWKIAMMVAANEDNDGLSENHSMLNSYRCPMHTCATCASRFTDNPSSANTSGCRMFRCIRCPTAYHAGDDCIAAGSIILPGLNIICPDHFEPLKSTPYHQPVHVSWCFVCSKGGELVCCETCPAAFHPQCVSLDKAPEGEWYCRDCRHKRKPLYGDIVWVKLGSYRWWPGEITHPHDIPDNIKNLRHGVGEFVVNFFGSNDYFWLNRRRVFAYQEGDTGASTVHCSRGISSVFNKALREASHKFKELSNQRQKLHDVKSQKKRPQYKFIKTNKPIGNVQVYTADLSELPRCICKRTDSNPCGPDSECLNRMLMYECHPTLCPAGDKCQNQHFQKRDYPQSEVFKTSWGGWGLKTTAFIKKGQFVNEYVGELVDSEECMRRIEQAHKNNVTNFYMLTIDKDRIIDAGPKGNLSRFMNHSCDPSCETQKWTVNGDTRVGLFARHQIQPGEELTFNYNLDCLGNDKTPCMCGAKNCSGFIGVRPKPQQLDSGRSLDHKCKKKRRRVDQRELPKHDDFCFRCRQVGTLVCCDVRGCQRAFCLSCLRLTKPPFGKWECPWHHCDFCGRRAQSFCHFCPNSFCASHVMNQLVLSVPNQYDCCTDHDPNVAEYEMEEAIAAVVASMLPADNWADKTDEIKLKETVITTAVRISEEKKDAEKIVLKAKRVRSKSKSNSSKHEKKGGAKKETDDCDDQTSTLSSLDQSHLTESDLELGPPTSSPVRRKRVKRHYFRGTKKRKKSKQRLFDSSTGSLQSSMSIGSNPPSDDADTQ